MCIRAEIPQPNIALNIEIYCWSCGACWFSRFKSGRNHFSLFCPFLHLPQHKTKFLLFPFCVQRGGQGGGGQHGGGEGHVTTYTPLLGGKLIEIFNQSQPHLRDFFCV